MYYHGHCGPYPPYWGPPITQPPMDPRNPTAQMNTKELRKAIKFYQQLLKDEDEKKKKKDGDKPPTKNSTFTAIQWMALLMLSSPFLGLAYLKLLTALAASLH